MRYTQFRALTLADAACHGILPLFLVSPIFRLFQDRHASKLIVPFCRPRAAYFLPATLESPYYWLLHEQTLLRAYCWHYTSPRFINEMLMPQLCHRPRSARFMCGVSIPRFIVSRRVSFTRDTACLNEMGFLPHEYLHHDISPLSVMIVAHAMLFARY